MADSRPLADDFLGHLWPPFTQLAGLKPTIMERAEGALVYDTEGNAYIDAFASLWTVNVGHGRKEIFDAIADLRPGSKTFGKSFGIELSGTNGLMLYVPVGFAHGFCVTSDVADVIYKDGKFKLGEVTVPVTDRMEAVESVNLKIPQDHLQAFGAVEPVV